MRSTVPELTVLGARAPAPRRGGAHGRDRPRAGASRAGGRPAHPHARRGRLGALHDRLRLRAGRTYVFGREAGRRLRPDADRGADRDRDRLPRRGRDHPPGALGPRAHDGRRPLGRGRDRHGRRRRATTRPRSIGDRRSCCVGLGPVRWLEGAPVIRDFRRAGPPARGRPHARAARSAPSSTALEAPACRVTRVELEDEADERRRCASSSTCRSGTRASEIVEELSRLDGRPRGPLRRMRLVLVSAERAQGARARRRPARLGGRSAADGPRSRRDRARPSSPTRAARPRFGREHADAGRLGRRARTRGSRSTASTARPGVLSARYAGEGATDEANVEKLLAELAGAEGEARRGRYVCELVARLAGRRARSAPRARSRAAIATERRGTGGFGYDPVFVPEGESRTVAELGDAWKAREQPPRPGRARARGGVRRARANGVDSAAMLFSSRHEGRAPADARRSSQTSRRTSSSTSRRSTEDLEVEAGNVLCREGEAASEFFVIIEGEAEVDAGRQAAPHAARRRVLRRDRAARGHPANRDRDREDASCASSSSRASRSGAWSTRCPTSSARSSARSPSACRRQLGTTRRVSHGD